MQRVNQDFLVPPELLDFLALKETVVILDVQVAQDHQDNQVSRDQPRQVLKEILDQQDLLDAQVLKVHLAQKVLAALLAMEVSEVRKVILASLDNPDFQDQKETQEHPEYRVSRDDQV